MVKKKTSKELAKVKSSPKPTVISKNIVVKTKKGVEIKQISTNSVDKSVSKVVNQADIMTHREALRDSSDLPPVRDRQRIRLDLSASQKIIGYKKLNSFRKPLYTKSDKLVVSNESFYYFMVAYATDYAPGTTTKCLGYYGISYTRSESEFACYAKYTFNKQIRLLGMRARSTDANTGYPYFWRHDVYKDDISGFSPYHNISHIADGGYPADRLHYWYFLVSSASVDFAYFSSLGILTAIPKDKTSLLLHTFVDSQGNKGDFSWVLPIINQIKYKGE